MPRVLIREGASGILSLSGGRGDRYVPDCDLDKALALLFRIYDLKDSRGGRFKDNYWRDGFNWLSGVVGWIYWRACYRFVQYRPVLEECLYGDLKPVFANSLNFKRLLALYSPRKPRRLRHLWHHNFVLPRHNREWAKSSPPPLLFYRYGPKDFRSREFLRVFEERGTPFSFAYAPSPKLVRARRRQGHPVYFFYRDLPNENVFGREYDLSGLPRAEADFLAAVVREAERRMSAQIREYGYHLENFRKARPKLFFGLDDHNDVYPALFACKTLGVPSIGWQLGMYSRLQAAYTLEGWKPGEYQWYDHVITWGDYWEQVVRRWSRAYPDDFFLPGANKHAYGYKRLSSPRFSPKNVLVPYEFFANTYKIGLYIRKLVDLGYTVYFKFKPDQRPERQLESYCLPPEYAARLTPVHEISDELMAEINIVAGAMTTLLFDLLPYGKETWVLDTEFGLLDDMVADGLARRVGLDELPAIEPPAKADHRMDYTTVFRDIPVAEVLERHVLSRL